jgi:hypothetical protein
MWTPLRVAGKPVLLAVILASLAAPQAHLGPGQYSSPEPGEATLVHRDSGGLSQPAAILSRDSSLPQNIRHDGDGSATVPVVVNQVRTLHSDLRVSPLADAYSASSRTSGPLILLHCLLTI